VLKSLLNSHRANRVSDDLSSYVDALNESAVVDGAVSPFDAALVSSSPTFPGSTIGANASAPSEIPNITSTVLDAKNAPAVTIADGASVEIADASVQPVTFIGTTGTLKLDDSLAYTGLVTGLAGSDAIDLADVSYGIRTRVSFVGNASGGTLTITDGVNTANIALQGDYLSSSWDLVADGNGGTTLVDPVWQTLKIGGGGWVTGLDIAPDGTMVARTDTYGAYIWNGTQWQQLVTATSMPAAFTSQTAIDAMSGQQGVDEIQIAPSNSSIMYMMYDGYVFKSINMGTSWTQTSFAQVVSGSNDTYRMDGQRMAIDPNNPSVVYVGTPQSGLFVTTNGGVSWQNVTSIPVSTSVAGVYPGITGILFDPAAGGTNGGNTDTIFASSWGNGVYESTNAGVSWTNLAGGPGNVLDAAVSSTGAYYAVGDGGTDLWAYANNTWTELLTPAVVGGNLLQGVAIDPLNASEIVVISQSGALDITYNGGATWSSDNWNETLSSSDVPWLTLAGTANQYMAVGGVQFSTTVPNQLVVTDGIGVWTTTIPTSGFTWSTAVTWNDETAGIENLVAREIIVPPGGNPVVASEDRPFFYINDANAYPSNYGPVQGVATASGFSIDYASSDPTFLVGIAEWQGDGAEDSGYSTDGGQTWTLFPSFIPGADTSFMGGTIAASTPTNFIWAPSGGNKPYYTLNGGKTWNPITLPGVSSWSGFDFAWYLDTRTVTADRVLSNTFYLYDPSYGVFETTNGGVSWTEVHVGSISPLAATDTYNSQIESVPGEAGNLFFTAGPQTASAPVAFYRSTNQGSTWTTVANVQNVSCFGYGAAAPGQSYPAIYIVGNVNGVYGIWQSINNAQSWTQIGTNPNNSINNIVTIAGDPNVYGQVYVGFSGSGYAVLTASPGPTLSSVTESPSSGDLNVGDTITLTLNFSSAVSVAGGSPTLTLNDGGTATFTGGSGSSVLTFSYTVGAGQNAASLAAIAVNLNGATMMDSGGNAANISLNGLTQTGPQIDTTTPAVTSVVASGTGITAGAGDLGVGRVVTLTVNLSEVVTVTGGSPTLTLSDGGIANYNGGSGTNALTFSYTVGTNQNTSDLTITALNSNSATITNGAGTAANLSGAVVNPAGTLQIDTTTPSVALVVASGTGITAGSGDLNAGHAVTLTLNMSEAVTVSGGTPTLTLNDGGTATYTGGSGTNALTFSYTVGAGQNTADLAVTAFNSNSATIKNGAGTAASLSGAVANPSGTLQIDTTAPTVTQVVASPGSGTENPGNVVTLTVDFSNAVTVTGTPTLTLNDGAFATYLSGSGTSALTFSYTVKSTDSTVPTLAITQANLPSGATIKDAAGNAANLSGAVTTFPGLSIDPPPVVVSVSETPSTGDLNAGKTITLTLTLNDIVTVAGGTPTLALNDGGTATYIGGSGTNTMTFRYTVGAGDNTASLAATGFSLNGATVQNSLGEAATISFSGVTQTGPQIDTATPTVTSVAASGAGITAGTGDLPAGSVVTLTISMSEAVTVAGGSPTLTLNDGGTATYSGGSGTNALTFSYTVAAGQSTSDLAITAVNLNSATVKDSGGNAASLTGAVTSPSGTLQIDGITTRIAQVGSNYFLDNISGTGPELTQRGVAVGPDVFAAVGAVHVSGGGYDVAWQEVGSSIFTIWSVDSSGNFISSIGSNLAGNSTALENFETIFGQDLNGDGTIGPPPPPPPTTIQTDGTTTLVQSGNNYFLDVTGSNTLGPELTQRGVAVGPDVFAAVGAVQVAGGGYDVAWQEVGSSIFTIWSVDSSGNFISSIGNNLSGTSATLENFETIFHQDLNGDGVTGIYAAPGATLQISNLSSPTGSATIGAGATLELTAADSSSVTFTASTGMLELDQPSTFAGTVFGFTGNGTLSGSDQIDLKGINFNTVHDTYSNGVLTVSDGTNSAALDFNGSYTLANFSFVSDGKGGTILYDPPVPAAQGGSVPVQILNVPPANNAAAVDQQLALLSQHIAAAFPSSAVSGASTPLGTAEVAGSQLAQITTPAVIQLHA
jgi:hypothetical protein